MSFDTPVYFVFLALVVLVYWRLAHRGQNVLLLVASYFFYGWWDWRFLAMIFASTLVGYLCGRLLDQSEAPGRRRLLVTISIVANLSFLAFFKYFNFFVDSLVTALHGVGVQDVHVAALRILLPPGISFYTFQGVAYMVDVYRRKTPASRSLVDYALFISLFPQVMAGPIHRPSQLLPQIERARRFDPDRSFSGILLILQGLFRKCVVADNCALLANAAFGGSLGAPNLAVVAIGTYAFAWQIYGDFSGYTDIARGSAQLLGFQLTVNFRQPYFGWSIQEFWRRWHISLSTWLRDYLFFPLSYWLSRRFDDVRWLGIRDDLLIYGLGTFVTMLLAGLWHGANWTFVAWGALFGVGLGVERVFWTLAAPRGRKNPLRRTAMPLWSLSGWGLRLFVFHFVCFSWILFRATSFGQVGALLHGLQIFKWLPEYGTALAFLAAVAAPLFVLDIVNEARGEEYLFETAPLHIRLATAMTLIVLTTLFSANELNAFAYFQF